MIDTRDITGLILAGGRGSRMGGVDKGLQGFRGQPLALHVLRRLQPQVGSVMISANRNLAAYEAFGVPVWPDGLADHAGPLAGFLIGLEHCTTPWLLTVPCDSPCFPADLASRLAAAATDQGADIAMAAAPEQQHDGSTRLRTQPVFCLLRVNLLQSLQGFTADGGREIHRWAALQPCAIVPFDQAGDDPLAFFNANTPAQLHALDGTQAPC
ncbi:molybdenum cofactor guanylyltransferase MobA [Diaphorobacter limosus]|uniref:Molybdenum cofactor guanylyltransferase n=1 Tax=Diaphorobacter limosus TaxID=3036128 RepID=A0ABZ0J842_9BURK|nr:molybdenum cofactor guanylyltransferase MobA [Diaphorobacter sp. Y-1]WOO33506.1 molybdenum cofactor guanylyltransferase MobA [Diaphorobacter sp. Y-1]